MKPYGKDCKVHPKNLLRNTPKYETGPFYKPFSSQWGIKNPSFEALCFFCRESTGRKKKKSDFEDHPEFKDLGKCDMKKINYVE